MGETHARVLDDPPIRDAATIIVVRDPDTAPRLLMGQRGKTAAFMPSKFVFPGGAVDIADADIPLGRPLPQPCRTRLDRALEASPEALAAAAIRELWEETGQIAGTPGDWADAPPDWKGFAATGHRPDASVLSYVFRAVTPPGRPRRFDARFFIMDAARLVTDPDDFTNACDELSHLQWVTLTQARALDLPFITSVVLGEVEAHLPRTDAPDRVPFFRNDQAWRVIDDAIPTG
ncbi:NUDIX domain protein [Rhodobacteraceae bacterium THAF1]|uniref:NUDIX hydrolase n=1 Tax=Palleronia sp. THAF1 TaxID=2587842 RepID=UPI000F40243D|nr:NUDIX hydrolase [Palleronia sp. THAF1]QFU08110.1 NUDIX domain protein [Palleronia sp. THAF1]VDC27976.1 NUDIX domain protein [Rhodobacteraceae bacterium THAF1]